ncbi:M48 family metallopeptidase [Roseivivax sediminis]|uniref:Peptidase family M48 n=1 Tax=Roseivivax sediminis TaxID=936889 RepID=A0A1I2APB3_9RHOB|nr:M48 family metallopeptidase [Roseivivax sediminis]SFE45875.1 Peptidase family M48 [Roseivivax sediminis]
MRAPARFHDGERAKVHDVEVALGPDRLTLVIEGTTLPAPLRWPLSDLRALRGQSDARRIVVTRAEDTGDESLQSPARLEIEDTAFRDWLLATRPNLFARDTRPGTRRKVALWLGGAAAAVAVMLFVILPLLAGTLARMLPLEREIAFGKTVTAQMERLLGAREIGALDCTEPAGRAALDAMTGRLMARQDIAYDLNVRVFDHEMINAFAAPGGQVVLIRGLIEEAETPEALAAVLAHEIGHVVHRDPTRAALRTAGSVGLLGLVFGDFAGGAAMLAVAQRLIDASYSRTAETEADAFAHRMLAEADISPAAIGEMFARFREIGGETPGALAHFASHPQLDARIDAAQAAIPEGFEPRPLLNDAQWQALQGICGADDQ